MSHFTVLCSQGSCCRVYLYFIPPSQSSFVLFTTWYLFPYPFLLLLYRLLQFRSGYSIFLPSCRRTVVYLAGAFLLTLLLIVSFDSSPHHFTALLHTINFFPIALLAVVLTNFSHSFYHPSSCISLCISFYDVRIVSNSSDKRSAFSAVSSWNSCRFLSPLVYILSITSSLYTLHLFNFPTSPMFDNSRLLTLCSYKTVIRTWKFLTTAAHACTSVLFLQFHLLPL